MNETFTNPTHNFERIKEAIAFLQENYKKQPSLDEIAAQIHLSPFHFQKLFTEWAGISPKKFLQFLTISHAKKMIETKGISLFDVAHETGLSGTGRLHDLFVNIEAMTPGEYKNGGNKLLIRYHNYETLFGNIIIGSTASGICYTAFEDNDNSALGRLFRMFPQAEFLNEADRLHESARDIFDLSTKPAQLKLHLKASPFQLKVWEALLQIPAGNLTTYGKLARQLGNPNASRAVGTAIGDNPVAFIIPCHRVIQGSGMLGGYHWGLSRKAAMIGWEASKIYHDKVNETN